jgi:hypothetical protein
VPSLHTRPLTDDEFEELAALLDRQSPLNTDGLFGVLHAVAVAPSVIVPSTWLPIVLPEGIEQGRSVELLLRMHNEVLDALNHGEGYVPPDDDVEACVSFAGGYAAAATLDPQWIGDADRWTFASPIAYLAERRDLVPPDALAKFDATPDTKDVIRRYLAATVVTTHKTFVEARRASLAQQHHAPAHSPRIGRNDPCPCGSGKKFKRCCIDRPRQVNSN